MPWQNVWDGNVGGRAVRLQKNEYGDLRVATGLAEGGGEFVSSDQTSVTIHDPKPAGSSIHIYPDPGQSMSDALMEQGGFTAKQAVEIASHAP